MPERSGGGPPGSKVGKLKSVLSEKSEVKDSPWSPAGSAGFLLALQFAVIKSAVCPPKPGSLDCLPQQGNLSGSAAGLGQT
jgi:hypothetical protein